MVRPRIPSPGRLGPLLAVGGLDPSGHAGILADARVFESFRLSYRVALTAVTAQSEKKFLGWEPVSLRLFRAQLEAAGSRIHGVKIGMLGTHQHAKALVQWLKKIRPGFVVWDPLLRSSTGSSLFRGTVESPVSHSLWELSDAVTPNWPEAEELSGHPITDLSGAEAAMELLYRRGKSRERFMVLKGGHAPETMPAIDLIRHVQGVARLTGSRRPGSRRGSGCTFASVLLVGLCQGKDPIAAARFAKREVLKKLFDGIAKD